MLLTCIFLLAALTSAAPLGRPDVYGPLLNAPSGSGSTLRENSEFEFSQSLKVVWPTTDLNECQGVCADVPGCMSYTRVKGRMPFWREGTCFVYHGIGRSQKTTLADSGVLPPQVQTPGRCLPVEGVTFMGAEVFDGNKLVVQSIGECCLRCQALQGCKVYTFLERDGSCWLKADEGRMVMCKEPCQTGILKEAFGYAPISKSSKRRHDELDMVKWDFIQTGLLREQSDTVWKELTLAKDALRVTFSQYAFSVTGSEFVTLTLASGKSFVFDVITTNKKRMFHLLGIKRHSKRIIDTRFGDVDLSGSQLFIQFSTHSSSHAIVRIGFKGDIEPTEAKEAVLIQLKGFFTQMVENMKLRYKSGDCEGSFHAREVSGACNNPANPSFGATNSALRRLGRNDPSYADGISAPSGPTHISARLVSNEVGDQGTDEDNASNRLKLTDAFVTFGQFVSHDFVRSAEGTFSREDDPKPFFSVSFDRFTESMDIPIPPNDKFFTWSNIHFTRSVWMRENNEDLVPRQHRNLETSYLDLSLIYGSQSIRSDALRSFEKGKMKTNDDDFLPFNGHVKGGIGVILENIPLSQGRYVSGETRCNVSPNLAAFHALWLKEHNKVAEEIDIAFGGTLNDDQLHEIAKAITIAEYQSIVYTEFLKLLLGDDALDPNEWKYRPDEDASVDEFFVAVAHRFGHSMINNFAWMVAKGTPTPVTRPTEKFMMRDIFFDSSRINSGTLGDWFRGMSWHQAREMDSKIVNELRNFLFTSQHDRPSNDLLSLNIQRARDFGLPMYNAARDAHGLDRVTTFEDVTCSADLAQALRKLYPSVDDIDPFVGGISECASSNDRLLGDLFHASLKRNYKRLRDGDRLFYKGLQFSDQVYEKYPRLFKILTDEIKLKDIIIRNTDATEEDFGGRGAMQMH